MRGGLPGRGLLVPGLLVLGLLVPGLLVLGLLVLGLLVLGLLVPGLLVLGGQRGEDHDHQRQHKGQRGGRHGDPGIFSEPAERGGQPHRGQGGLQHRDLPVGAGQQRAVQPGGPGDDGA